MKNFKTNDVLIRRFKESDIDKVYEIINNTGKISNMSNIVVNENKIEIQMIIKSAIAEYYTEEPIWALEDKQNKNLFGCIKIDNYSPKNKMCKISWAIIDTCVNEILITQALKKIIDYLFNKKGIELIECSYYGQNEETDEILDKVGMKKEAVLKRRRYNEYTNKREDFIIYSIDISDFNKLKLCNA